MKNKQLIKSVLLTLMITFFGRGMSKAVTVDLYVDEWTTRPATMSVAERSLSALLTEVNYAQKNNTHISNRSLNMSDFAKKSVERIWTVTPFYCPEEEVLLLKCIVYGNGNMEVRNIPLIIKPQGEMFGNDDFQNAVVEFDAQGKITDFRFTMSAHPITFADELDKRFGNEVVETEQLHIIRRYMENFRTAYNQKDITTIENLFSDDALIITGHVTQRVSQGDGRMMKPQVVFNKQTKQQYIANLKKAFARNKWIQVTFDKNMEIRRSKKDPTMYGLKVNQSWKSSNYSDEGCLFLIWQFRDGEDPIIHVRTWQPLKDGDMELEVDDDISSLAGFDL